MVEVTHTIYEHGKPILSHVFHGETLEDALKILKIHTSWDQFLRAAVNGEMFQGMVLGTSTSVREIP